MGKIYLLKSKYRGFEKPVKYIVIGSPNLTKTTCANKLFGADNVFETDSFKEMTFRLSDFDLSKQAIVIGGRYYKKIWEKLFIIWKLKKILKKTHVSIIISFKKL